MRAMEITAEILRQVVDYDPETGGFTWRARPREHFKTHSACNTWNSRYVGKQTGCRSGSGYLYIRICGTLYMAHRLAWLYMTGEWPKDQIDHVNINRSDNRFCNLREATQSENMANIRKYSRNTSGRKGVAWDMSRRKWLAQLTKNGKRINLGRFDEDKLDDAALAYERAAREHHGEFARVA